MIEKLSLSSEFDLVSASSGTQWWESYHNIIEEAFASPGAVFDREIIDSYPNLRGGVRIPLVLLHNGRPVATSRIDFPERGDAVLRLVASAKDVRGQGNGRKIVSAAMDLARVTGSKTLRVNAAPRAVAFYVSLGFVKTTWDDGTDSLPENARVVQMACPL